MLPNLHDLIALGHFLRNDNKVLRLLTLGIYCLSVSLPGPN